MSCDYRIMSSGPYRIGLNETQLGIAAPLWFAETMAAIVGQRQTEKLLQVSGNVMVMHHFCANLPFRQFNFSL
jgi:enoyl-CoA hydratase/carnithine racemase